MPIIRLKNSPGDTMHPTFVRARILNDSYTNNFENLSRDYREITWAFQRMNYSLFDFKTALKPWQEHLEILANKFIQINFSLAHLVKGTPFPSITTRKVTEVEKDMSSIYILIRAVIETYLTLYYLNFQVTDDNQGNFRNQLYKHSGLARRQSFHIQGQAGKLKLESERLLVDELKKAIQDSTYFNSLDKKKRATSC